MPGLDSEWEDVPCETVMVSQPRVGTATRAAPRITRGVPYVRSVELKSTEETRALLGVQREVAELISRLDPNVWSITTPSRCGL